MKNNNTPLVACLAIAVIALSSYIIADNLYSQPKVLGNTTISQSLPYITPTFVVKNTPTPSSIPLNGSIPCSVISQLQQTYCRNITATPTKSYTTPTITCKVGLNSFGVDTLCNGTSYRYARYSCYDGLTGILGSSTSCKSQDTWKTEAYAKCSGRSNCATPSPKPTYITTPTQVGTTRMATPTINIGTTQIGSTY